MFNFKKKAKIILYMIFWPYAIYKLLLKISPKFNVLD